MRVPPMIAAELRRLTSTKMAIVALAALLAVPILYGGLYLWANQDPYANLTRVPVALVVDDEGADINGAPRDFGEEVAERLVEDGAFDWHRVSSATAEAGLGEGGYDFTVEIPDDFSAAIASISTADPRPADIVLRTNDANNYLASTIGAQAVERIRATVAEKVVGEAGLTLLDTLHSIRLSLVDAASGAQRLVDGLDTARSGSAQLADGSTRLADGTAALHDGAAALAAGAAQVSEGAAQVSAGTQEVDRLAQQVATVSQDAAAQIPRARADISSLLTDAGLDQGQVAAVLARLDPVGERLAAADARVQDARARVDLLADGAAQVSSGSARVASGAADLTAGAAAAADGAAQLRDGAAQLDGGLGQLADGARLLQSGLADGAARLPDTDDSTRRAQANTLSDPVAVSSSAVTSAQNYGAGLAPFFAALAGWIGIYALFLIVKPISRRAITALHSPVRVTLAGWLTPAMFGGLQMLGLFAVLAVALGFRFSNPGATLGILLFASATYAGIVLALNVWLGSVGQFLGLVLMVLQLVTAGGTFPWQTLPAPLAALHHVLPMGHVVDALRQAMYGGDLSRLWGDVAALGVWLVVSVAIAAIGVDRMTRSRTLRDLRPSLIG